MDNKNWFTNWFDTNYYHQLYFNRDNTEANTFIINLINHLKPNQNAQMLDVACGKGRHSKYLNELGYHVTGIDLSENSIKEAQSFENEALRFYKHDMRQPFHINYFDYAFNFFTSFGYFAFPRENEAALRSISQSLKPHGTLVIDYLNVHYAEDHLIHTLDKEIDGVNYHITKWMDEQFFYKKIEVEDENLTEPLIYIEKVSKFSLGDFTDMLAYQNMQVKDVFGDYNLGSYHVRKSPRMIILAEKIH